MIVASGFFQPDPDRSSITRPAGMETTVTTFLNVVAVAWS